MRDLVFPSTSDKATNSRYMNGRNHLQKSLTGDSSNQDTPSDDESISESSIKDRIQNITPGNFLIMYLAQSTYFLLAKNLNFLFYQQIGQLIKARRLPKLLWYLQPHLMPGELYQLFRAFCVSLSQHKWIWMRFRCFNVRSFIRLLR